jgi:hypothetical protein
MVELYPAAGDDLQRPVPVATTMSDATGTFTLLGIPRGDYVIRVLRIPALPEVRTTQVVEMAGMTTTFVTTKAAEGVSPDPTWWSATPVAVSGRDVIDLAVPVAAGTRLRGRVVFEGSAPQPKPGDWLRIQSADGRRSTRGWRTLGAHVDERGGFLSPELPPGRYVLRASVVAPWTLKSVALNERDVADGVIEIGSDPAAVIVVTMIDVAAGVSGVVRTQENRADTDAAVVVFPVDRGQWTGYGETARRLRLARVDRAGRYALTGLPPGSYFIVAVPDAITDGWMNPAFLARVESRARRVELRAGEQQTLDLRTAVVR